ncbi:MAG: UDP-3-O-(3-hydroxymyristoyl)glucosamine N-acyltransferase [Flavobacteriales bacterium]|nr:UDP-3-O-(3-hydroxymyristoyl)glucosamine N-acyltransferase [Flavobacteriales bacterium]MBK6943557.1 UDP-3-O-(3-hydroxymyristoyl)glucosamine N-acyltransferase [Flavobacteriales bacterium]MBK7297242.1 UDP-3-O-(3-hydroxymyristoyl)glucosamine N-acyltransferase [Flavobacteriales bacterium]MBK9535913.1 UDP-3-O-(3-hydroxymyristoyl)glucosamine N-acyltransferase [Flavobacteriales bacterium]MBP9139843.1 UDP-3-O-(3-hydroxymyristoyl)glucosamine N-acyltransferase [Flavobacteriales bacterium]
MDLTPSSTAKDIAQLLGAEVKGNSDLAVTGINEINRVRAGDLVYVDHPKYYEKALNSAATTILLDKDDIVIPDGKAIIISDDPCRDYNTLIIHFNPRKAWGSIEPLIGRGSEVHSSVVLGSNVRIGVDCLIMPGVVIYENTTIGNNVIIHANTVIGSDPFYYKKRKNGYEKMVPGGSVVIEDDVEIGAQCAIDRGVSAETRIGRGTKIDNHVHIGHDTLIGRNCLFAGHVAISGAVVIEDDVTLWGQAGVPSKLRIGKGATLLGQSAIMNSVEGGKTYLGSPAGEWRQKMREIALIAKLPDLFKKMEG